MNTKLEKSKPWYKEPWAWFVAAPIILVFLVSAMLVTTAVRYGDDVITDDYYKEGRLLNNRFIAEQNAKQQGVVATLTFQPQQARLELQFEKPLDNGTAVRLQLSHPAKAELDQRYEMQRSGVRSFFADSEKDFSGRWYIRAEGISSNDGETEWRISGETDFSKTSFTTLQ